MTPLDHALYYASRGWRVVPIPPGEKFPRGIPDWQDKATTDAARIRRYWTLNPTHGVGIATGPETGLFVVDIDPDDGGDDSLAVLEAAHGPLPDTIEAITGGGGRHLVFAWPETGEIRNSASGTLGAGIDVRGVGGQFVVAPTIHPNGTPYAWEIEHDPFDGIAAAPAPEWLLELLQRPLAVPEPRRVAISRGKVGDLPGDVWAASTTWAEQLTAAGATLHSAHHDTTGNYYELWTRPGKLPRDGASASLYYGGSDVLKVFTSNWAGLDAEATYTLWGFHVATEHGGDFEAAASKQRHKMIAATAPPRDHLSLVRGATALAPTPAAVADPEAEETPTSWESVDLAEIAAQMRSGAHQPTLPTVLAVDGALPLLYPGRINSLFGESGGGKTWVALAAVAEVVRSGRRALFVDYEDNPTGITERLIALGLDDDEIALVDYRQPDTGIAHGLEYVTAEYGLVVFDSTGEAMAIGGIDSNSDTEVATWFSIVKHYGRLPGDPAVVTLDHIPKDRDAPSSYAIGSQRKRAAVTGAAYRVDTLKEPAKGRDGKLKLTVAKDRPGNRPKGAVAAIIDLRSTDGAVELMAHLSDAQVAEAAGEKFRPTVYMERVSRWVEINPGASTRDIVAGVTGRQEIIKEALAALIGEGFVTVDRGARGASLHTVNGDGYREGMPSLKTVQPVDNPSEAENLRPRPTASHRVPDAVPKADDRVPLGPSPTGGSRDAVSQRRSTSTDRVRVPSCPQADKEPDW